MAVDGHSSRVIMLPAVTRQGKRRPETCYHRSFSLRPKHGQPREKVQPLGPLRPQDFRAPFVKFLTHYRHFINSVTVGDIGAGIFDELVLPCPEEREALTAPPHVRNAMEQELRALADRCIKWKRRRWCARVSIVGETVDEEVPLFTIFQHAY